MQVSAAFLCGFRSDQLRETADGLPVNFCDRENRDPARRFRLARSSTVPFCRVPRRILPSTTCTRLHHLHPTTFRTWRPFGWERHPRDDAVADI